VASDDEANIVGRQQQKQATTEFGNANANNALAGQNNQVALGNVNAANQLATKAGGTSDKLFNSLFPTVQGDILNPQGYGQGDMAAMNTAVGQAAGGAAGAEQGRSELNAARTRNIGGFQAGSDEAAREGMRTNAAGALSVQGKNADMKQNQRAAGIKEMSNMFGMSQDELLKAMGLSNQALGEGNQAIGQGNSAVGTGVGAVNAGTNAGNNGWFQNMMALLNAGSRGAGAAAGA
jgi:hypothetical protein